MDRARDVAADVERPIHVRAHWLYWTAIINGLLAPFLLVGIWLIAADRKIMCNQPSSRLGLTMVGVTILVMFGAAIGMFVF